MNFFRSPIKSFKLALVRWWLYCALCLLCRPAQAFHERVFQLYVAGTTPIFIATPKSPNVRFSTANTNRDGTTGTYGTLFTAGSNGSLFAGWRWTAEGNTTAGAVRLYIQDGGSGNVEMKKEMVVPAVTFSAGVTPVAEGEWYPPGGIMLSASSVVKVSTHIGETFSAFLEGGGDY